MGVSDTTEKDWEEHYQKLRAEAERIAMCESRIHKVSADDIKVIRNSAIDEFIEHSTEVAEENRINASNIESNMYIPLSVDKDNLIDNCIKCAEEHEQLVRWLEELKAIKENNHDFFTQYKNDAYDQGRNDALDDFQEWLKRQIVGIDNNSKEVLVVRGDRWELAIDVYKKEVENG